MSIAHMTKVAISLFFVGVCLLGLAIYQYVGSQQAAYYGRLADDKDYLEEYAKSVSIDALELALDTAYRKNGVTIISTTRDADRAREYIEDEIKNAYGNKKGLEIKKINIDVYPGAYSDQGGKFTQTEDQRAYIKGNMEVVYATFYSDDNGKWIQDGDTMKKMLTQEINWFIYANPIHKSDVF